MFSGFSRRQTLKMIVTLVVGAASAGSIPLIGKLFASAAQAQEGVILEKKNFYKGKEIKIKKFSSHLKKEPELYINDRFIESIQDKKSGRYATGYFPHEDFESLEEMAKEMVDLGIQGKVNKIK